MNSLAAVWISRGFMSLVMPAIAVATLSGGLTQGGELQHLFTVALLLFSAKRHLAMFRFKMARNLLTRHAVCFAMIVIFICLMFQAADAGPPGTSRDTTQPVPDDAGQLDAPPLAASGGNNAAAGGDSNTKPGNSGTGNPPDGAWGGDNSTTADALDAVVPVPDDQETHRRERRNTWLRQRAGLEPTEAGSDDEEEEEEEQGGEEEGLLSSDPPEGIVSASSPDAPQPLPLTGQSVPYSLSAGSSESHATASASPNRSSGLTVIQGAGDYQASSHHLAVHVRDGYSAVAPPQTSLHDYGMDHNVHHGPGAHGDRWLNINMRCGYDIQHPDPGDDVNLARERQQRAACRMYMAGQRPWNIQPENDSQPTVELRQARRQRGAMQDGREHSAGHRAEQSMHPHEDPRPSVDGHSSRERRASQADSRSPWNIQPENDSLPIMVMGQTRRGERIGQVCVWLVVMLACMALVFNPKLLEIPPNGHCQEYRERGQAFVDLCRLLLVDFCFLMLLILLLQG